MAGITLPNGAPLRMIATDMDGTLMRSNQTIDQQTKEHLIRLQEAGVRLLLVSGRPLPGLRIHAETLQMDRHGGALIGFNGAEAFSYGKNEDLWVHPIASTVVEGFFAQWADSPFSLLAYSKTRLYYQFPVGEPVPPHLEEGLKRLVEATNMEPVVWDFQQKLPEEIIKLGVNGPHEDLAAFAAGVASVYEDALTAGFSGAEDYEAVVPHTNKGTGLQQLAEMEQIAAASILAFGDQDNDISMLSFAGFGVAMGNASEKLMQVAKATTTSNEDAGIARFLKTLDQ